MLRLSGPWRIRTAAIRYSCDESANERFPVAVAESRAEGITYPPLDELLEKTDSKYSLVIEAARRARQINAYYSQLSEGLLEFVGPLVETRSQEKPLSIAMREINAGLLTVRDTEETEG